MGEQIDTTARDLKVILNIGPHSEGSKGALKIDETRKELVNLYRTVVEAIGAVTASHVWISRSEHDLHPQKSQAELFGLWGGKFEMHRKSCGLPPSWQDILGSEDAMNWLMDMWTKKFKTMGKKYLKFQEVSEMEDITHQQSEDLSSFIVSTMCDATGSDGGKKTGHLSLITNSEDWAINFAPIEASEISRTVSLRNTGFETRLGKCRTLGHLSAKPSLSTSSG